MDISAASITCAEVRAKKGSLTRNGYFEPRPHHSPPLVKQSPATSAKVTGQHSPKRGRSIPQVSDYHKLLHRVERNPSGWCDLAINAGRETTGFIVEQGSGKGFLAFAFDRDGGMVGSFRSRKAARRAVSEAYRRRQAGFAPAS